MEVFYNGQWRKVTQTRPGFIYINVNGGMWAVAAGMPVREISAENRNLSAGVVKELQQVSRAARKAASARQGLEQAVRSASAAGLSLREIAQAAGISHEQVRRLIA